MATFKTGWLLNKNGEKFAPRTLMSQVSTNDGTLLEQKIETDLLNLETQMNNTISTSVATEKSERQAAIATEKSERQTEIAVERARIDTFVAMPEGATTNDAELADIKVKVDGTTASTAGNAVREQINTLDDKIDEEVSKLSSEIDGLLEESINKLITPILGALQSTTGKLVSGDNYVSDFIPTNGKGRVIYSHINIYNKQSLADGIYKIVEYDSNKQYIKGTISASNPFDLNENTAFIRVERTNDSIYTQLEFADATQGSFSKFQTPLVFKGNAMIPSDYYNYHGNVVELGYTNFYSCNKNGYYSFKLADVASITDAPADLRNGGFITVHREIATNAVYQELNDTLGNKWCRFNANEFTKIVSASMLEDIEQLKSGSGSVWYALGDSITQGFCSYIEDDETISMKVITNCWVNKVADLCGYTLTNHGVGGSGFVHNGTVLDKLNARNHVDTIDFSNCDLATIAYGVNDWKYNTTLGSMSDNVAIGGTFYSNMRYVIEKILGDNPLCKIVVITPLNCSAYGDESTNWGIGYSFSNNGTLEEIFEAEKEVCEYYGIEMIDMTHNSVVNRKNITSLLLDGVHPIEECHEVIAKELAKKINFK